MVGVDLENSAGEELRREGAREELAARARPKKAR